MSSREYRKKITSSKLNTKAATQHISEKKSLLTVTRRAFVVGLGASIPILSSCSRLLKKSDKIQFDPTLSSEPWKTIDAVYSQLLPADGNGPSYADANATEYLFKIVSSSKTSKYKKKVILNGEKLVDSISIKLFSKKFIELSEGQKEKTLRKLEESEAGEEFLSTLMNYLFEALLGDPVYGCQPKFAGWQWLGHIPGFPRPEKPNRKVL